MFVASVSPATQNSMYSFKKLFCNRATLNFADLIQASGNDLYATNSTIICRRQDECHFQAQPVNISIHVLFRYTLLATHQY